MKRAAASRSRKAPRKGSKRKTSSPAGPQGEGWVTLSNHRRVELDAEGRLLRGLPSELHGVHVQDISEVSRRLRKTRKKEVACKESAGRRKKGAAQDAAREARQIFDETAPQVPVELEQAVPDVAEPFPPPPRARVRGARPRAGARRDQLDLFGQQDVAAESRALVPWGEPVYSPPEEEHFSPEELQRMEEERCELNAADEYEGILQRARKGRLRPGRTRKRRRA